jgi:polysaccharide export outer membrane protein
MGRFAQTSKCSFNVVRAVLLAAASIVSLCVIAGAQQQVSKSAASKDVKAATESATRPEQLAYIVGEGDLLRVSVWKEPEISQNVSVRPDGMISLPLVAELHVSGLTPEQVQQLVTEKLKTVITNPQVTVTVLEVHSKQVYITGEVGKPGAYQEVAPMNVLQLIARAGGLNEFANRKAIYIFRAGDPKTRLRFNYKEVVNGQRPEQNIILQPGDTVVVP